MSDQCAAGRPVPDLPTPSNNTTGDSMQPDLDSDHSSSGRRHIPSSVSKTSFAANTPASQKRAIQRLKQSLTFSDHSSASSASSTPHKTNRSLPSGQGSTHSLKGSTHSAPAAITTRAGVSTHSRRVPRSEVEGSEYMSEGEAPSGININTILSKLDQVKSYLQEAEALHMQMKERLSEPGMTAQVSKMGKLVEDLRRQESGYLGILFKLLDQQENMSQSQLEEVSGDGGSEGEIPSDTEGEGGEANDSMSLKAELLKEKMVAYREEQKKQEEQLQALRQQRDLLRKLLDQQKQIEALESRLDKEPTSDTGAEIADHTAQAHQPLPAVNPEVHVGSEQTGALPVEDEDESAADVARRLSHLREKQARIEQLTQLLNQLKTQTAPEERLPSKLPNRNSSPGGVLASTNINQPQGASASRSEMVAVGDQAVPVELRELQQKLKQAEEARTKLSELQNMLLVLQQTEGGAGLMRGSPQPATASRQEAEGEILQRGQNEEEEDQVESEGEMEQSALSEYEERLERRRQEVRELQEQRDKLLSSQRKLQSLQLSMSSNASKPTEPTVAESNGATGDGGPVLSSQQLASELGRQRKLYDDLLTKTEHIQSMVDEVAGTRDVTAATWGGSSSSEEEEEEEEEGASTTSQPPVVLDDTQDTMEHTYTATLGDSATEAVEVPGDGAGGEEGEGGGMVFRVTRHTPRPLPGGLKGGQRRLPTPEQSLQYSAGKRMKLDDTARLATGSKGGNGSTPLAKSVNGPSIGSYSAAWPGVIFPTATRKHTRDEATQTGELMLASCVVPPAQQSLVDEHISLLHHQLGVTSSMATQLLHSQQGLMATVCRQLESLQLEERIQDHFAQLHQYQTELEQYYTELQNANAYPMPSDQQQEDQRDDDQLQEEEEEEEDEDEEVERDQEEPIFRAPAMPNPPPFTSSAIPASGPMATSSATGLAPTAASSAPTPGHNAQQTSTLPPQAPMNYFPHMYQPQPVSGQQQQMLQEEDVGNTNEQVTGSFASAPPPPPIPPYFHHHSPYPPYHHPPWIPPSLFPTLPPNHHMANSFEHSTLHPSPTFGLPHPSYPSPYTRLRLSWPPPHYPGVPPFYPGYPGPAYHPGVAGGYSLNSSGYIPGGVGAWTPPVSRREGGEGRGQRLYSPSGVTGVSMQVQPPTSPPSAPSVTNLQHTSSLSHPHTGSGPLPQAFPSTLRPPPTSTTLTGHPKTSSLLTFTNLTPHIPTSSTAHHPLPTTAADKQPTGEGERRKKTGGSGAVERQAGNSCVDEESLSSMPLSLPDTSRSDAVGGATGTAGKPPEDFSVFDALRDTIYSEVATLIANNENRPHFLVELFRELQMLSSDYLRQRALYSLQDLVTRYITEESLQQQRQGQDSATHGLQALQEGAGSEATPSESLVTSDDELVRVKPVGSRERGVEGAEQSGSSTPPRTDKAPFAADNIGDTVVRLDKAMARLRESYMSGASPGTVQPPVVSPGPLPTAPDPSHSSHSDTIHNPPDVDTQQLDMQIKTVVTEVIPLLKEHMASPCSAELLQQIKQLVISLILDQLKEQNSSIVETFSKHLESSLQSSLLKYLNKMLRECGEALLVEVSEVLFNELAFFRLMQTMGVQKDSDLRSTTSQSLTTTEDEGEKEETGKIVGEVDKEVVGTLPILQALTANVAKALSDEQEALGKTRDDELAREWNAPQDQSSSPSLLGEQTVVVELSASESKPVHSAGSGEEEEEEEEEEKGGAQATTAADTETEEKIGSIPAKTTAEREETPPTPVIAIATTTTGTSEDSAMSAQSPPLHQSNAALEVQMKVEQQSTEGIAGILATIEQQQELTGEGDQLPQPGPSEALAEP